MTDEVEEAFKDPRIKAALTEILLGCKDCARTFAERAVLMEPLPWDEATYAAILEEVLRKATEGALATAPSMLAFMPLCRLAIADQFKIRIDEITRALQGSGRA